MTKATAARAANFFQIDFDPETNSNLDVPELYRNRLLITFAVNSITGSNLADLKSWMATKWSEIPSDGKLAFTNNLIAFLRHQTVILGESGYHIAEKVFFLQYLKPYPHVLFF